MPLLHGVATADQLRNEIQGVPTFCGLTAEENRPLETIIKEAIAAAAPYVQVPSHLMRLPTGEMRGVNYDHTILGWRGAILPMGELGGTRAILPNLQAMWYVPPGLNIREQTTCEFPRSYRRAARSARYDHLRCLSLAERSALARRHRNSATIARARATTSSAATSGTSRAAPGASRHMIASTFMWTNFTLPTPEGPT